MANSKTINNINVEAMEETLRAAKILLPTHDLLPSILPTNPNKERLGFPSALLLCCFIEAFGHRVLGTTNAKTFQILRHQEWFNIGECTGNVTQEFYNLYRSKLCHNLILPSGFWIEANPQSDKPFSFNPDNGLIVSVNLVALLHLCTAMFDKFKPKAVDTPLTKLLKHCQNATRTKGLQWPPQGLIAPSGYQNIGD